LRKTSAKGEETWERHLSRERKFEEKSH